MATFIQQTKLGDEDGECEWRINRPTLTTIDYSELYCVQGGYGDHICQRGDATPRR